MNDFDPANHNGSAADTLKLLGTQDESFNVEGRRVNIDLDLMFIEEISKLAR